jgi:hypothetical protein
MTYSSSAQRDADLKALRELGFSNLPADQQARLVSGGELDEAAGVPAFKIGDLVGLDPTLATGGAKYRGVTFKVLKVNPKTLKLQPLNGGRVINADKLLIVPPPETTTPAGTSQDGPLIEHLPAGTLVRLNGVRQEKGWLRNGNLGVVLVDKGDRINVAPLGGHPDDTYARLPRRMVTVVNPQDVLNTDNQRQL